MQVIVGTVTSDNQVNSPTITDHSHYPQVISLHCTDTCFLGQFMISVASSY